MFEFDQYEPGRHAALDGVPVAAREGVDAVRGIAFLWWSEHCMECAEPDCYTTCALYQRRPDGRCRRFVWGIRRDRRFRGLRGYGADVAFKTWGKLEAHGNALMEAPAAVLWRERLLAWARPAWPVLARLSIGPTRDPRRRPLPPMPRRIAKRLQQQSAAAPGPTAFLVDVWNPAAAPVALQVAMRADDDSPRVNAPPPFLTSLDLPPGRSCHRIPAARFAAIAAGGRPFKISVMPAGDAAVRLVFLVLDLVAEAVPARPGVKCVVFDLDGTLWDGVLVEGGDTRPRPAMVDLIRALDARGILVSVASKNDHAAAMAQLEAGGLAEHVLHPQIGWGPKSAGLATIAARLNIALDSFVFVDDSPFERAEVAAALPMVECVAADDAPELLDHPRCAGSGSSDARNRRRYYRDADRRDGERATWDGDYLGFLRACQIVLQVDLYRAGDYERVVELVQRTNQLNFSGTRYGRADVDAALATSDRSTFVLRCRDRFGDYGTIGVAMVRRAGATVRVEEMMLSCRVQGRCIEAAFLGFLERAPLAAGAARLWVRFTATARNAPAAQAPDALEFAAVDADGGRVRALPAVPVSEGVVHVEAGGAAASAHAADSVQPGRR